MISPFSSYFAKNNFYTPIKNINKKLLNTNSMSFPMKNKDFNKTPLSQIYRKKILYGNLKTPINRNSFLNQSQK